jgi:hypothetical protein
MLLRYYPQFSGPLYSLDTRFYPQLAENIADVLFDGVHRDDQFSGDVLI